VGNKDQILNRLIGSFMCMFVAFMTAPAAIAQTASADSRAVTIGPMSVVKIADLDFGSMIAGTSAGTVTVDTRNGNVSDTGGVTRVGGTTSRAEFIIYGPQNQIVRITVPTAITISRDAGGANMAVDQMSIGNSNRSFGRTVLGRLSREGVVSLTVGARLNVAANQQEGAYSGTFDMTVDYF